MACFVFLCRFISCSNCQARTRLVATASTSSRIPCSSRKLSKVEPLKSRRLRVPFFFIGFLSRAFLISSRQGQIFIRCLLCFLYETVEQHHSIPRVNVEQDPSDPIVRE